MKKLKIIESRCPQNHTCPCVELCPQGAIKQEGFKAPFVNQKKCIKCGLCTRFCPNGVLIIQDNY